jgi:hypothetical protein
VFRSVHEQSRIMVRADEALISIKTQSYRVGVVHICERHPWFMHGRRAGGQCCRCGMLSWSSGLGFFLFSSFCLVASTAFSCKKFYLYMGLIIRGNSKILRVWTIRLNIGHNIGEDLKGALKAHLLTTIRQNM